MVSNNGSASSLSSNFPGSPLSLEFILDVECGNADYETVLDYCKQLKAFTSKTWNITHRDYYQCEQHLKICQEYLEQFKQQELKQTESDTKKYDFLSRKPSISYEELERDINTILELNNPSETRVISDLDFISRKSGIQFYQLQKLYQEKQFKLEKKADLETKRELNHLIKLEESKLNLQDYFPGELANCIINFCDQLDIKEEAVILPILASVSSLHNMNSRVEIHKGLLYYQNGGLYSMIVGEPGSMKSTVRSVFSIQPLKNLQKRFLQQHEEAESEYLKIKTEYDSLSKQEKAEYYPEGLPKIIDRPNYAYIDKPTVEAFVHQFNAYPEKRIFLNCDELKGWFDSHDQYKGGKGSDRQAYLEMYDGNPIVCVRAKAEGNIQALKSSLSIFGTTQPDKLQELLQNGNDGDGMFSRFLYFHLPSGKAELPKDRTQEESKIVPLLQGMYEWLITKPACTYVLSDEAYQRFRAFYSYLGDRSLQSSFPFMQHIYNKAKGHCARLAMNLHVVDVYLNLDKKGFSNLIDVDVMQKAITLTQYFCGQAEYQFKTLCENQELALHLKTIIDIAKRKGKVTVRDLQRGKRIFRNLKSEAIKEYFYELENFGKGKIEKRGNTLIFLYPGDSGDSGDSRRNKKLI